MRRLLIALVVLMVAPGVAYAGGGGVDTSGCAGYSDGTSISMQDSCFGGTAHFAPAGNTITVSNDGMLPHTLTAVDGSFDTGQVAAGDTAELTFEEPGIYRVFCSLHGTAAGEGMAGVVLVGDAIPTSVAAPLDTASFEDAVVAQAEPIWAAMDNQGRTMGQIRSIQADIQDTLAGFESGEASAASEMGPDRIVFLVLVGLAVGVALASLLLMLRLRVPGQTTGRVDVQIPSESSVR